MSFTRCVVLAAVVGCGLTTMETSGGDDNPLAPDDGSIKAVVAHFAKNGVKLEKEKEGNYWVVTDPKGDGDDVIVAWRTWPAKATEEEMQAELMMINLAFLLNAPARVAMSKPGLRSADPAKKLPRLDQVPVVGKLEKLFKDYKPPAPDDDATKAFVAYLGKNGVKLDKGEDGWWVLADAKGDGYHMAVVLRTFPAKATEQEMRDELKTVNLVLMLNAPARVAMCRPSLRVTDPDKKLPVDQNPVAAKLEKLFKEYRPPEPKK